jgi:hypothetical protein
MPENVQFSLSGKAQEYAGEITGSGSLKLETDASTLCFQLDYKSKDKVILTLSGTQGIKLSHSTKLKFSESISKNLVNNALEEAPGSDLNGRLSAGVYLPLTKARTWR